MPKRILVGAVLHSNAGQLSSFFRGLSSLKLENASIRFAFIDARTTPLAQLLSRAFLSTHKGIIESDYVQSEALSPIPKANRLAWFLAFGRNRLIQEAIELNVDALLILSDRVVLNKKTLEEMLSHNKNWIDKIVWKDENQEETKAAFNLTSPASTDDLMRYRNGGCHPIGTAGECMLIKGKALGPGLRYQFQRHLGLFDPDLHLALRGQFAGLSRWLDCDYPLYLTPSTNKEQSKKQWLASAINQLFSYDPETVTGLEGLDCLCEALRGPRREQAHALATEIKNSQTRSLMYVSGAQKKEGSENTYLVTAVQDASSLESREAQAYIVTVVLTKEDNEWRIADVQLNPLDISPIQEANRQRYAIPPLLSIRGTQDTPKNAGETHRSEQEEDILPSLDNVKGLKIYRLNT